MRLYDCKMAAGVDIESDMSRNYMPILQDIDGQVAQILADCESRPRGDIVESLVDDVDADVVIEARNVLFRAAQSRYDEQLDTAGIDEQARLCIKTRKGDKARTANARDVSDLFLYVAELTGSFPREVLSCNSKIRGDT